MAELKQDRKPDEQAVRDLVRWAVKFYNDDCLFVELSLAGRNRIDQKLRRILDKLDVVFDGRTRD